MDKEAALGSALKGPALISAALFVAGFSYEWAFYYNFGVEHLARQLPALSTAIAAFEVVRNPWDALGALLYVCVPLLAFAGILRAIAWGQQSVRREIRAVADGFARVMRTGDGLIRDAIFALLLVYGAAIAGSSAGTHAYQALAIENQRQLPRVTAIFTDGQQPIVCGQHQGLAIPTAEKSQLPSVIGEPAAVYDLRGGGACDLAGHRSWRLLYRDERFVYLFQTVLSTEAGRPITLVIPNDHLTLILNGATADGN
jgi:hypothetical protein